MNLETQRQTCRIGQQSRRALFEMREGIQPAGRADDAAQVHLRRNEAHSQNERNAMKEHPILFKGEMVRAILEGRKTQTRRIGKIQSPDYTELGVEYIGHQTKGTIAQATYRAYPGRGTARHAICECPYGKEGDRLWVKETFAFEPDPHPSEAGPVYRATDPDWETMEGWTWKPSIFMPRALSRITLEITNVRVQRIQEISEDDAKAEGIEFREKIGWKFYGKEFERLDQWTWTAKWSFETLWDSINSKRGFGWSVNPWVWALTFKVIEVKGKP